MTVTTTTTTDEYGDRIEPIPAAEVPDLLAPAYGDRRGSLLGDDEEVTAVMLLGTASLRDLLAAACLYTRRERVHGVDLVLSIRNVRTELARFVRYPDAADDESPWRWRTATPDDAGAVTITLADITCGGLDCCWDNITDIPGAAAALARIPARGATMRTLVTHTLSPHYPGEWCRECGQPAPCTAAREATTRIGLDIDPDRYGPAQPCTCRLPRCGWHSRNTFGCMTEGCACRWHPAGGGAGIPPRLAE